MDGGALEAASPQSRCRQGYATPRSHRWLGDKESACNAGHVGSIPGSGRSIGGGNGKHTPVFLPGESHGRKSLVGYSPWGRKESQLTQQQQITFIDVLKGRKDHVGLKVSVLWGLFAGPVVKTPCFHSRRCRFDPWSGS